MVLCFRGHFECSLQRQSFSRLCWRISFQHHPRAWAFTALCLLWRWPTNYSLLAKRGWKRKEELQGWWHMAKMDRRKQERERQDVTYGLHTQSIREGPKRCLCQSNGCMLSPSPPWEGPGCRPPAWPGFSTVALICNQRQTQQLCCNQVCRKFPVAPCGSRCHRITEW